MAFSFGASSPATSTFSGFGFGSSTPAFGSSASAPAFGASTPAFGAQPSLFGSQPANAFGASSSSFSFQTPAPAQSTPGFSFQTPGQSSAGFGSGTNIFGSSSPSLFGTSAPAFGAGFGATPSSQPQAGNALALAAQPGPQLQFQQHHQLHQQQQQALYAAAAQYVTKQNQPLTHRTQWDDIGPNGQSNLLEIDDVKQRRTRRDKICRKLVAQQRDGCRRLDAAAAQPQGRPASQSQPSKSSQQRHALKQGMQAEARPLHLALQLLNDKVTTDSQAALQCEERDMELMQDVELGIRAFQRCVLWTHAHQAGHQLSAADRERLSTPPILPSPFLCHSIPHLQEKADECTKLVSELERVLPASALQQAHASRSSSGSKQATQMLETALLNMHDYFVHVAARVAALQEATEAAREAHLGSKRLAGDSSNPFEAADLREAAAAAEAARAAAQPPSASSSAPATAGPGASGPAPLTLGAPGQPSPSALPSSQTPSLFPAATPAASSAAGGFGGGFLFGQTGAASNPAQTPGFGFGATPAASPAAGGLFGGISPASASAGNLNQSGSRKSSTKRR